MSERQIMYVDDKGVPHTIGPIALRDYFAAQALMGEIATPQTNVPPMSLAGMVRLAYEFADAMLKEREKARPA